MFNVSYVKVVGVLEVELVLLVDVIELAWDELDVVEVVEEVELELDVLEEVIV